MLIEMNMGASNLDGKSKSSLLIIWLRWDESINTRIKVKLVWKNKA